MTITEIKGVRITAPMFNGAPVEDLEKIIKLLQSASFHFADDTTREWSQARAQLREAAALVNKHRLLSAASTLIYQEASPIISLDSWIDEIIIEARRGPYQSS